MDKIHIGNTKRCFICYKFVPKNHNYAILIFGDFLQSLNLCPLCNKCFDEMKNELTHIRLIIPKNIFSFTEDDYEYVKKIFRWFNGQENF